jgi:membrane-associated phospholipid phosphatase
MAFLPSSSFHTVFSPKRFAIAGFIALVGAVSVSVIYLGVQHHNGLAQFDYPTLLWSISHRSPTLTTLMKLVTTIFSPVGLAVIILASAVLWALKVRQVWRPLLLVGSMGLSVIFSTTLKHLVMRSRPPQIDMIRPLEIDYSFPSGHTLGIAVCLLVVGYLVFSRRRLISTQVLAWAVVTIAAVTLVACSRLYLGYHWLTDVSASVGVACVILAIIMLIDPLEPRGLNQKVFSNTDQ